MRTISIAKLKAQLIPELMKVKNGERLLILDHQQPVAKLVPIDNAEIFVQVGSGKYEVKPLKPLLTQKQLNVLLTDERKDS
ncbi:MAG: hypothetical protein PQJ58_03070 [Spirochaetales bacterium]|nr:hypothetical protein [Spirochaetales bacterium]